MSTTKNPLAFPSGSVEVAGPYECKAYENGITLRDYFAAKAMQNLVLQNPTYADVKEVAAAAYAYADAMLEKRNVLGEVD